MIPLNQISILLILFFASLLAIIVMIGRKLVLLKHKQTGVEEEVLFEIPYLKEVKHLTVKNVKKHGYNGLVAIVRLYVKSTDWLKNKYEEVKTKIKNIRERKLSNAPKKEISKFLKIISEYKQKIGEIKHKIKNGEKL